MWILDSLTVPWPARESVALAGLMVGLPLTSLAAAHVRSGDFRCVMDGAAAPSRAECRVNLPGAEALATHLAAMDFSTIAASVVPRSREPQAIAESFGPLDDTARAQGQDSQRPIASRESDWRAACDTSLTNPLAAGLTGFGPITGPPDDSPRNVAYSLGRPAHAGSADATALAQCAESRTACAETCANSSALEDAWPPSAMARSGSPCTEPAEPLPSVPGRCSESDTPPPSARRSSRANDGFAIPLRGTATDADANPEPLALPASGPSTLVGTHSHDHNDDRPGEIRPESPGKLETITNRQEWSVATSGSSDAPSQGAPANGRPDDLFGASQNRRDTLPDDGRTTELEPRDHEVLHDAPVTHAAKNLDGIPPNHVVAGNARPDDSPRVSRSESNTDLQPQLNATTPAEPAGSCDNLPAPAACLTPATRPLEWRTPARLTLRPWDREVAHLWNSASAPGSGEMRFAVPLRSVAYDSAEVSTHARPARATFDGLVREPLPLERSGHLVAARSALQSIGSQFRVATLGSQSPSSQETPAVAGIGDGHQHPEVAVSREAETRQLHVDPPGLDTPNDDARKDDPDGGVAQRDAAAGPPLLEAPPQRTSASTAMPEEPPRLTRLLCAEPVTSHDPRLPRSATYRLNDAAIGTLEMRLDRTAGALTLQVAADQSATQEILRSARDELETAISHRAGCALKLDLEAHADSQSAPHRFETTDDGLTLPRRWSVAQQRSVAQAHGWLA